MLKIAGLALIASLARHCGASAGVKPYPARQDRAGWPPTAQPLFVRIGGHGPGVVLLHGYGETGDMWEPLAVVLAKTHTVVIPDLRGMGLSAHPGTGYDKKNQGRDIAGILDALHVGKVDVVAHDIGNMVGYAFVAEQPERVTHLVLMDAPIPGVGPWDEILKNPLLWHFRFGGPDMERLVKRPRAHLPRPLLERILSRPEELRRGQPGPLRRALRPAAGHARRLRTISRLRSGRDRQPPRVLGPRPLLMPVLAIGGETSFGPMMAVEAKAAASDVQGVIIPHAGHWVMEENPTDTVAAVTTFPPMIRRRWARSRAA